MITNHNAKCSTCSNEDKCSFDFPKNSMKIPGRHAWMYFVSIGWEFIDGDTAEEDKAICPECVDKLRNKRMESLVAQIDEL